MDLESHEVKQVSQLSFIYTHTRALMDLFSQLTGQLIIQSAFDAHLRLFFFFFSFPMRDACLCLPSSRSFTSFPNFLTDFLDSHAILAYFLSLLSSLLPSPSPPLASRTPRPFCHFILHPCPLCPVRNFSSLSSLSSLFSILNGSPFNSPISISLSICIFFLISSSFSFSRSHPSTF